MRDPILVACASRHGGTTAIAERISGTLRGRGLDVTLLPASDVDDVERYGAFVIGSAIYAGHWRRPAYRVVRLVAALPDRRPVWLFHSGPLGGDAQGEPQGLPRNVRRKALRVDLLDIATFGGVLSPEATGFPASAMAKNGMAGDWRDFDEVDRWAGRIADSLLVGI